MCEAARSRRYTFAGPPPGDLRAGRARRAWDRSSDRVRLTVTPIGSATDGPAAVAAAVVEYLEGPSGPARGPLDPPGSQGPSEAAVGYYADSVEGPGTWMGRGAAALGLTGDVERRAFANVLEGRHPTTGERLLGATGSAGRKGIAVGTAARFARDGEALYGLNDVAKLLRLSSREVGELVVAGDALADDERPETPTWLRAEPLQSDTRHGGQRLVRASEVERFAELVDRGVAPETVIASGSPDDVLSVAQAARLMGVDRAYLRRCCRVWQSDRMRILAVRRAGQPYRKAWLVCDRSRDGRLGYTTTRRDLAEFARRRRRPAVRVGFDLTLSTEKSVAILAMLSTGDRHRRVIAAIDAANDTAIDFLERHAAFTRRRGRRVATEGLVVASYLHTTSRSLDPFPHRHNIVANAATDAFGDRKALDGRALYDHAAAAAALATAELRWRLAADLGVRWRRSPNGIWEVDGIPDAAIAEFSTRRRDIDDAVKELERELGRTLTGAETDVVVKSTRAAKTATDRVALLDSWWQRATAAGLDRRALDRCFGNCDVTREHVPTEALTPRLFAHLAGRDGVTSLHSLFRRGDVIREIADWCVDGPAGESLVVLPPGTVERLADLFLASDLVTSIDEDRDRRSAGRDEPIFTTVDLLATQAAIHEAFHSSGDQGAAVVGVTAADVQDARPDLSDEQARWASRLVSSTRQFACAVGHPGSGKTYALGAAASIWFTAGWRVVGAAVKGEAARTLAASTDVPCETLAWFLAQADDPTSTALDGRTVLLVDEASTIGDRDLARLVGFAQRTGATVRLVGDPAQHGSVPAGGTFAALARSPGTPTLTTARRVENPVDRHVAAAVRAGDIGEAFRAMQAEGRLDVAPNMGRLYTSVVTRWAAERAAGRAHPMVDRRRRTRRVLNELAHRLLQSTGEVGKAGVSTADGLELCVGDEVVARVPARHLHPEGRPSRYVRNGSRGVVRETRHGVRSSEDVVVVDFEHLGVVEVPRSFFDDPSRRHVGTADRALDHGYAITSYAAQGATFPTSTSAISPGVTAAELYVDITRGRQHNHVVAVRPPHESADEAHLPRPPSRPILDELADRLGTPCGERTGYSTDPKALTSALVGSGRSLASLHAERRRAELAGDRERAATITDAGRRKAAAVARAAVADPSPEIRRQLPPRPLSPWRGRRWDDAVAAIAVYRARYTVGAPTGESLERLIGRRPQDMTQASEWDAVVDAVGAARTGLTPRSAGRCGDGRPDEALSR